MLPKAAPHPAPPLGAPSAIGIISLTAGVVCEKRSAMNQHNDRSDDPKPVIEPGRGGAAHAELTTRALHLRICQQEILAELGVLALQGTPFLELLNQTARLTAEGMEAEFCKVLEYIPPQNRLLVRAELVGMRVLSAWQLLGPISNPLPGLPCAPVNQ